MIKRISAATMACVTGVLLSAEAVRAQGLTNGDFSSGTLTGWDTTYGAGVSVNLDQQTGNHVAWFKEEPGLVSGSLSQLSQSFTLAQGTAFFSFQYRFSSAVSHRANAVIPDSFSAYLLSSADTPPNCG